MKFSFSIGGTTLGQKFDIIFGRAACEASGAEYKEVKIGWSNLGEFSKQGSGFKRADLPVMTA
jgi:hypothetical protein